jgi:iron-sulfur cluster assembly accessory protein
MSVHNMANAKSVNPEDWGLSLTDSAAGRILDLMAREEGATALRLSVSGGGCSGFQYAFSLDKEQKAGDCRIERNGASLVIDLMSVALLKDSEIDWHEDIAGSNFVVKNPNATAMCGCGTSFSVG